MSRRKYSLTELTVRLFRIAVPIRKQLVISTLASITGNLSHMGFMAFGSLWLMSAAGYVYGNMHVYSFLTVLCGILIAVCRYLEGVFSHLGAYGILAKMRVDLFEKLERIAPAYMIEKPAGEIMNIAVSDIETLEFFFAHTIGPMFTVILLPLAAILTALHFNALYALILIPFSVLISIVIPLLSLKAGRKTGERYRSALAGLKAAVLESVYGIRDIQIFSASKQRTEKMEEENRKVSEAAHGLTLHRQTVSAIPDFMVSLSRIMIIAAGGYLASKGVHEPAGTVVVAYSAAASFSSTFSLTFVVSHLLEAYAAAARIFEIEDTVPAVRESENPVSLNEIETIRFEDVTFHYPSDTRLILDHCSFTVNKGETVGIAGESGIGKSTILRLLLRFYEPSEGRILINGIDLKDISLTSLHEHVGLLEQETYLFDRTIAANIAIAAKNPVWEDIIAAAKRAEIGDMISALPMGYNTPMGQMSGRLSGGEKQRTGIARIFLRDPDVLVMDEPTSALDMLREKEIMHTLKQEYGSRTVIIISHRASTLAGCDRVLTLKNGKAV